MSRNTNQNTFIQSRRKELSLSLPPTPLSEPLRVRETRTGPSINPGTIPKLVGVRGLGRKDDPLRGRPLLRPGVLTVSAVHPPRGNLKPREGLRQLPPLLVRAFVEELVDGPYGARCSQDGVLETSYGRR